LGIPVKLQRRRHERRQVDAAIRPVRFHRAELEPLSLNAPHGALNCHRAASDVDIIPPKSDRFPNSHPRQTEQHPQRVKAIGASVVEEHLHLFERQDLHLLALRPGAPTAS
jgi:hypothetical protein